MKETFITDLLIVGAILVLLYGVYMKIFHFFPFNFIPKHRAFSLSFKRFSNPYDYLIGWVRFDSFVLQKKGRKH